MLKSIISSIILICFAHAAWGQIGYSASKLDAFVQVYMGEKNLPQANQEELQSLLLKYAISQERYSQLFHAGLTDEKMQLSEKELAFTAELKNNNDLLTDQRVNWIQSRCSQVDLPHSDYLAILSRYKAEIKFQRSLQPYFENFLKKQH